MRKITAISVFVIMLLSYTVALSEPATEVHRDPEDPMGPQPMPDTIKIWEAYAKGWATIRSEVNPSGFPLIFRVSNLGSIKININEMVQLLSPHPLEAGVYQTTQDGALTSSVVNPYSYVDYEYADSASPGAPKWWCTEHEEVTQYGATIFLGGEIMPYALQDIVQGPSPTNDEIWAYLEVNPTLVVGKTPLWEYVEDAINHNIPVTLAVTNLAINLGGGSTPPHAVGSFVEDTIPSDYSYVPGSISPAPDTVITNPDGSTTIRWKVDVDAADVTGPYNPYIPTPYNTVELGYTLVTPKLLEGRYFLPRAFADVDHDGSDDSHSAKPLIEVYRVNKPPEANAGGPYEVNEGTDIFLDASGSVDPNGDSLQYRWDLDNDGAWDTSWSAISRVLMTCGDGPYETDVTVEVSDGEMSDEETTHYRCLNVAPTIDSVTFQPSTVAEGQPLEIQVTFYDPGWLDTHTALIDWNDGQTSTPTITGENQKPDATGQFSEIHTYGDDFGLGIRITVTDDDGDSDILDVPVPVDNVDPMVDDVADNVTVLAPRTQGYWNHQCNITEPYGDHTGITEDLILFVSSNSNLFDYVSTEEDICTVLEWASGEEMYYRAQGQLMALWLNTASGKLDMSTGVAVPTRNETTLGEILAWAESVLMTSTNESELEEVKTVADQINNGNYIAIGHIALSIDIHDPGSDDIIVSIDWGDGATSGDTFYNDGIGPDPANSPYGNYPFSVHFEVGHSYLAEGSYTLTMTIADDDGGETVITLTVDIYTP